MAAKKQQTHAKRARELAVKERRERKRVKKAMRAAGEWPVADEDAALDTDAADTDAADTDAPLETAVVSEGAE